MKQIQDNYIDLTITSPPYDDLRNYNEYIFEFKKIAQELFRITKKGGIVIWVVGDKIEKGSKTLTSFKQVLYFREIGFNIHDTMIYYKNNPIPTRGNRYHQHFEYMFCMSKGVPKTFNPIMEECKYKGLANMKNRGKNGKLNYIKILRTKNKKVGNVFFYSIGGGISTKDKIAFKHPAIFPEKLAEDQIITWSNEEDIVLDPMCGSGTTCKMAKLNNRKFIGIDISEEYCNITKERINLIS
jgi:site-specific DNA-methyltransferase (adenine-specific)